MISLFRKLRWLAARRRKEEELREELRFHLEEEAEEREAEGLRRDQALSAARRDLGSLASVAESTRAAWTWIWLEQFAQDLRYALRAMLHNRAFTALAVLSLALGIGANTAIFSFMDAILLRSLPVPDPPSLVVVNWHAKPFERSRPSGERISVMRGASGSAYADARLGITSGIFPYGAFELLRNQDAIFSSLFAYYPTDNRNISIDGHAEVAAGEYVSGDYFRGLAITAAAGRLLLPEDDRTSAPAVLALSLAYARKRFGSPSEAIGKSILIDNFPFTVAGVTPPEFFGVDPASAPAFYLPMSTNVLLDGHTPMAPTPPHYLDRNYYWIEMMGRLRPGVTLAQAEAVLAPQFHHWVAATAANDRERANLPALFLREGAGGLDRLRRRYSQPLYVLFAMVALILGIACANIANLLLARAAARKREMAVRLSLGAGRFRIIRQLLTESLLLAFLGALLGAAFAAGGIRFLSFLLGGGREAFPVQAGLDWPVLAACLALALASGILFGLAPAIQATRPDVMPTLKQTRAGQSHARRLGLGHLLVVSQFAISLLLLVGAGLFLRTLSSLESVQLGFEREHVLLFDLNARQAGYREPGIAAFYAGLRQRFAAIPGVRGASLAHASLLTAGRQVPISVSGILAPGTRILDAGPDFLSTMQIRILLGREIDERDQPASPPVAVVNELFVKANFAGRNPLGRRITIGNSSPRQAEIVGVCANVRYGGLKEDMPPLVYLPYNQGDFPPIHQMTYALRTAGDPQRYVNLLREIIRQADPRIPLANVRTQTAEIDRSLSQEITFAGLCTGFAILALAIACVGIYATVSYNVVRRTSEIGIRMALGARRASVVWMVLREVLALAGAGLALSVPVALTASRLLESFLFGTRPHDPRALLSAVAILLAAALLAGFVPARRASRIDPMAALRHD